MNHAFWVYILANKNNRVIYVGVTNNLETRIWEHKTRQNKHSFTSQYNVTKLVYYEGFYDPDTAISREKYIKGKNRKWKNNLIEKLNPTWREITPTTLFSNPSSPFF